MYEVFPCRVFCSTFLSNKIHHINELQALIKTLPTLLIPVLFSAFGGQANPPRRNSYLAIEFDLLNFVGSIGGGKRSEVFGCGSVDENGGWICCWEGAG